MTSAVSKIADACEESAKVQGDQLNMAMFFWYFVKSYLPSVRYCSHIHWISRILQGTRNTRPCLTGHPVIRPKQIYFWKSGSPYDIHRLGQQKL